MDIGRGWNLQVWERRSVGAIDSLGVNLGDMILIIEGVVGGGSGRTKSQGSKSESHRGAHVDLHVDLMLVGLVYVCFHPFIQGVREGLEAIITNCNLNHWRLRLRL